ncbi:conjugative transposon protein TraK [Dyadobacter luteus]|jgi:conjugative transposon TraK protein|uniref:Conjugative transposon protein TraK n=1 Tax=Dyadobacter luteus TaxID=2259619 RepID=A0A3D8YGV2_9BACT|nr:conjugative transposon protein TraK [Dyadobacter luteus]REA63629.1 conjugative transposon protein TraK [Dyadobacter luteus]
MFSKAKDIQRAFSHIRVFTFLVVVCSFLFCCFAVYKSYQLTGQSSDRIFILADGKVLEAYASDRRDNIAVEARDHVASFHRFFFTLDPDEKAIQSNVVKALYLADGSAKKQYDNLRESGFYTSIISGNISQQISVDSVTVDTGKYPYYFRCRASQQIVRATSIVTRSLVTEGHLRTVSRSDHNPHGFLIEGWTTLENKDISSQNRVLRNNPIF